MNTPRASRLQFSLRALLAVLTLVAIGGWWWQKRFRVESTVRQPQAVGRGVQFVDVQRTESRRRLGLRDTVLDGPTTIVNEQGKLLSEEEWRQGVRHGVYRRWDDDGKLLVECEFRRGRLVRVGERDVADFLDLSKAGDPSVGQRLVRTLFQEAVVNYTDIPLAEAIDDIRFSYNIPMLIDAPALNEQGVSPTTPITIDIQRVPLFVALVELLGPLDLACALRHELLWITTPDSTLFDDEKATQVVSEVCSPEFEEILAKEAIFDYLDQPLNEVLADISYRYDVKIDRQFADPSAPVILSIKGVSLRSALGILSHYHELQCVARDDTLFVTEQEGKKPRPGYLRANRPAQQAESPSTPSEATDPFSKDALSEDPFSGR